MKNKILRENLLLVISSLSWSFHNVVMFGVRYASKASIHFNCFKVTVFEFYQSIQINNELIRNHCCHLFIKIRYTFEQCSKWRNWENKIFFRKWIHRRRFFLSYGTCVTSVRLVPYVIGNRLSITSTFAVCTLKSSLTFDATIIITFIPSGPRYEYINVINTFVSLHHGD